MSPEPVTPPGSPPPRRGLAFLWRALGHRNYRLFFLGQGVSLVGTWMTRVATGWLVYRLTHSPFLLGLTSFAALIPVFLLSPFAGVLVDRVNRHRLLLVTQALAMLQSLSLAVLALSGLIEVWHVIALNLFQGLVNTVDSPARQSFLVEMVEEKQDLGNAIALNSTLFNGARLVGPTIAGALIAAVGEGYCFLLDGLSYVGVLAALGLMTVSRASPPRKRGRVWHDVREGAAYAFGFAPIRDVLLIVALISLAGLPYLVFMPVFAVDVLGGGPHTLGVLMAATGLGALGGALFMALRRTVVGLERVLCAAVCLFGTGVILFSLSPVLWLSLPLLLVTGLGMMVQMAAANTLLQTLVEDDKRGRVMSLYSMAFMGLAPFGSLLAGAAAQRFGAPPTVLVGGALCVLGSLILARQLPRLRELMNPIYARAGILPEVATGLQSATRLDDLKGE